MGAIAAALALLVTGIAIRNIKKYKMKGRKLAIASMIITISAIAFTTLAHMGYYRIAQEIYETEENRQKMIEEWMEDQPHEETITIDDEDVRIDEDELDDGTSDTIKAGPPTCPSGANGFSLGSSTAPPGTSPVDYQPPRLIDSWGNEAIFSCSYKRDTGEREYEGDIIWEDASIQAQYQTTGSFSDRPEWGKDDYCTGNTVPRGGHTYAHSSSHVIQVSYSARSGWDSANIAPDTRPMALELIEQIENAPYAIACQ